MPDQFPLDLAPPRRKPRERRALPVRRGPLLGPVAPLAGLWAPRAGDGPPHA